MNAEIKAKWVEALRSGKYEQSRGQLALSGDDGKTRMCCLGVLAHIQGRCEMEMLGALSSDPGREYRAGLEEDQRDALAAMNDGGATFAYLASYIEAHL